jgi:ligand-binding SRPBCC domain-containing protein
MLSFHMLEIKNGVLRARLWLPRPIQEVFIFFSDAENLEKITPLWLHFWITSPKPIPMKRGTRIDYKLRLKGLPLRWQSEISVWDPPHCFVDEQRKGPYKKWRHEHRFQEKDGGTLVLDEVQFAAWGGKIVEKLFVEKDLRRIFEFRQGAMQTTFTKS